MDRQTKSYRVMWGYIGHAPTNTIIFLTEEEAKSYVELGAILEVELPVSPPPPPQVDAKEAPTTTVQETQDAETVVTPEDASDTKPVEVITPKKTNLTSLRKATK